jgi:N-methylhydantoinase B
MGTSYRWQVEADGIAVANFGGGNRPETVPFGLEGGSAAPQHQLYLQKTDETIEVDAESFYNYDTGDVFEIFESGGGGYGFPKNRLDEKVRADVIDELVSIEKACTDYGVVIDPESREIDKAATKKMRESL